MSQGENTLDEQGRKIKTGKERNSVLHHQLELASLGSLFFKKCCSPGNGCYNSRAARHLEGTHAEAKSKSEYQTTGMLSNDRHAGQLEHVLRQ